MAKKSKRLAGTGNTCRTTEKKYAPVASNPVTTANWAQTTGFGSGRHESVIIIESRNSAAC